MTRKAYIAAPFETECASQPGKYYGPISNARYIEFLQELEEILTSNGWEPLLPHRQSNWGWVYLEPGEIVRRCLGLLREADLVLAYPKHSRGVHLETGYAVALRKNLVILVDQDEQVSAMVAGLSSVIPVKIVSIVDPAELREQLVLALQALPNECKR